MGLPQRKNIRRREKWHCNASQPEEGREVKMLGVVEVRREAISRGIKIPYNLETLRMILIEYIQKSIPPETPINDEFINRMVGDIESKYKSGEEVYYQKKYPYQDPDGHMEGQVLVIVIFNRRAGLFTLEMYGTIEDLLERERYVSYLVGGNNIEEMISRKHSLYRAVQEINLTAVLSEMTD